MFGIHEDEYLML